MSTQPGTEGGQGGSDRMFTQGEAYALVADGIARETAEFQSKVTTLEAQKAELETKVDKLETEKAAETARADAAEKAHTDFVEKQEQERQIAERTEARKTEVATANPFLNMTEERVARIAAMSDEDYASYLTEMREVAEAAKAAGSKTPEPAAAAAGAARATAAFLPGGTADKPKSEGTVVGIFGARAALSARKEA